MGALLVSCPPTSLYVPPPGSGAQAGPIPAARGSNAPPNLTVPIAAGASAVALLLVALGLAVWALRRRRQARRVRARHNAPEQVRSRCGPPCLSPPAAWDGAQEAASVHTYVDRLRGWLARGRPGSMQARCSIQVQMLAAPSRRPLRYMQAWPGRDEPSEERHQPAAQPPQPAPQPPSLAPPPQPAQLPPSPEPAQASPPLARPSPPPIPPPAFVQYVQPAPRPQPAPPPPPPLDDPPELLSSAGSTPSPRSPVRAATPAVAAPGPSALAARLAASMARKTAAGHRGWQQPDFDRCVCLRVRACVCATKGGPAYCTSPRRFSTVHAGLGVQLWRWGRATVSSRALHAWPGGSYPLDAPGRPCTG